MNIYPLLLSFVFIIHNLEEYIYFDQITKPPFFKKIANRRSFLFAIGILSLFVLIVSVLQFFITSGFLQNLNLLILFSLALNSIKHIFLSIWKRTFDPGTISAVLLMLPCSVFYFLKLFDEGKLNGLIVFEYFILSLFVMPIVIMFVLWFGNYLLSKKGD
jgi:hypothetical protein